MPRRKPQPADVIVILAGGVKVDGSLSPISRDRVEVGVSLFRSGAARFILMTGRWGLLTTAIPVRTEAAAMKALAVKLGVPARHVLQETRSQDTIGNAYFSRVRFLDPHRWRSVIVVTSDFHRARAVAIFRRVLGSSASIRFVTVTHPHLAPRRRSIALQEQALRALDRRTFDRVPAGNLPRLSRWLAVNHPAYSRHPERAKQLLVALLRRSPALWRRVHVRWRRLFA